jgi:hypothetical protein
MNPAIVVVRILQFAMIVSVVLFFFVSRTLHPPAQSVNAPAQWAIVSFAIACAGAGFIVQRILLRAPSQPVPGTQGSTARGRWLTGHVVRFATAESVAMFGIVLRSLGSSSNLVAALFASSLILLLFWQPGAVPVETGSKNTMG